MKILKSAIFVSLLGLYSLDSFAGVSFLECNYSNNIDYIGARQWKKQKNIYSSWYKVDSNNESIKFISISDGELYNLRRVKFTPEYIYGISCSNDCDEGYPRYLDRKTLEIKEGGGFGTSLVGGCEIISEDKFNIKIDKYKQIEELRKDGNVL